MKKWNLNKRGIISSLKRVIKSKDINNLTSDAYKFVMNMSGFIAHYDIHGFRSEYANVADLVSDLQRSSETQPYMYTKIKAKDGKETLFLTQQYEIGTYCIIDNDPGKQFGVDEKEEVFHAGIRKKVIKMGDTLLAGSFIPVKGKSKFEAA